MAKAATARALEARHGIPGAVRFAPGRGGLTRALLTAPQGEAEVYLHGAHVTHYQPRDESPILFLSARSRFAADAPIRGGVPIVFPWFGPRAGHPEAPMHGIARLAEWEPVRAARGRDAEVTLVLRLACGRATTPAWPGAAVLEYAITIGSTLRLALTVENPVDPAQDRLPGAPLIIEEALHTYLAVADVRQVALTGLGGAVYLDKTAGFGRHTQPATPLRLTGETDRVYLGTRATCTVDDPAGGRRLVVAKTGSEVTVVWNPWMARARSLADLGDQEWPAMLCVESANIGDHALTLAVGGRHTLGVEISTARR